MSPSFYHQGRKVLEGMEMHSLTIAINQRLFVADEAKNLLLPPPTLFSDEKCFLLQEAERGKKVKNIFFSKTWMWVSDVMEPINLQLVLYLSFFNPKLMFPDHCVFFFLTLFILQWHLAKLNCTEEKRPFVLFQPPRKSWVTVPWSNDLRWSNRKQNSFLSWNRRIFLELWACKGTPSLSMKRLFQIGLWSP